MTPDELVLFDLTVEHACDPIDVASDQPRFGWKLGGAAHQTGYQLVVECNGQPVWDSEQVRVPGGVDVEYGGPPLASDTDYVWRTRVWTDRGVTSWHVRTFSTTLLHSSDWQAAWLVPAQLPTLKEHYSIQQIIDHTAGSDLPAADRLRPPLQVRQDVTLTGEVTRARLFASSQGINRLIVNGEELDDRLFEPGFDTYAKRLSFSTFDVTSLLSEGDNAVGMILADGWWAGRVGITGSSAQWGDHLAGIWQLSVTYRDGRRIVVGSGDRPASSARGGWDYSDLYIGERYDARAGTDGWCLPGFAPVGWDRVDTRTDGREILIPFTGEPVRRTATLRSRLVRQGAGEYLLDLEQVIAGRLRITVRAAEGTCISIAHTEVLDTDGKFFENILGPNKDQVDIYICRGDEVEVYEPSFTFHGFRYARLTANHPFELDAADGIVIGTDLRPTAELRTSDGRVNRFHENVLWSQRGNFFSIPTDCPQRERAGWTGDLQVFIDTAATNMDVRQFVERWMANVRAEQFDDGGIPVVVPAIPAMDVPKNVIQTAAGWSDAVVFVPWSLWQHYADIRVLEQNFAAMRRWVDFQFEEAERQLPERLQGRNLSPSQDANHRLMWNTGWQFADWLSPSSLNQTEDAGGAVKPRLEGEVVAAAFHAHSTALVAEVAEVLGRTEEASQYSCRAARIRRAIAEEYVLPNGQILLDSQGCYVLALAFDLIPEHLRPASIARLVELIQTNGVRLDTGFLSTPYLLDVLWNNGEKQLARDLFWRTSPPSWLYPVTMGATTVWENWEAVRADGTPTLSSMNHYAFGCVDDWIYRRQLGIAPTGPGYSTIRIEPDLSGPLTSARGTIETVRGPISVTWTRDEEETFVEGHLPADTAGVLVVGGHTSQLLPGPFSYRERSRGTKVVSSAPASP